MATGRTNISNTSGKKLSQNTVIKEGENYFNVGEEVEFYDNYNLRLSAPGVVFDAVSYSSLPEQISILRVFVKDNRCIIWGKNNNSKISMCQIDNGQFVKMIQSNFDWYNPHMSIENIQIFDENHIYHLENGSFYKVSVSGSSLVKTIIAQFNYSDRVLKVADKFVRVRNETSGVFADLFSIKNNAIFVYATLHLTPNRSGLTEFKVIKNRVLLVLRIESDSMIFRFDVENDRILHVKSKTVTGYVSNLYIRLSKFVIRLAGRDYELNEENDLTLEQTVSRPYDLTEYIYANNILCSGASVFYKTKKKGVARVYASYGVGTSSYLVPTKDYFLCFPGSNSVRSYIRAYETGTREQGIIVRKEAKNEYRSNYTIQLYERKNKGGFDEFTNQ